jgi:hypothetical protein
VLVNGIEHSRNDLGINVVVFDPVTLNVEETESFDTGHYPDASIKLTEYIHSLPLMSMVFIVVRGEANFFLTGAIFFYIKNPLILERMIPGSLRIRNVLVPVSFCHALNTVSNRIR